MKTTRVRRGLPFMAATVLFDVEVIYIDKRGPSLLPRTTEWKYLIVFVGQDTQSVPEQKSGSKGSCASSSRGLAPAVN